MPSGFRTPDDPIALAMENDLLSHEVRFLRSQIAETDRFRDRAEQSDRFERELEATKADLQKAHETIAHKQRRISDLEELVDDLRRARSDLRWFILRLSGSPVGWLLRRWEGFRTLEKRHLEGYLDNDGSSPDDPPGDA